MKPDSYDIVLLAARRLVASEGESTVAALKDASELNAELDSIEILRDFLASTDDAPLSFTTL